MTKWCNTYGCWCVDVEEITDSQYSCNLNCDDCEDMERIEYTRVCYKAFKETEPRVIKQVFYKKDGVVLDKKITLEFNTYDIDLKVS